MHKSYRNQLILFAVGFYYLCSFESYPRTSVAAVHSFLLLITILPRVCSVSLQAPGGLSPGTRAL